MADSLASNGSVVPPWSPVSLLSASTVFPWSWLSEKCRCEIEEHHTTTERRCISGGNSLLFLNHSNRLLLKTILGNARLLSTDIISHESIRGWDQIIHIWSFWCLGIIKEWTRGLLFKLSYPSIDLTPHTQNLIGPRFPFGEMIDASKRILIGCIREAPATH